MRELYSKSEEFTVQFVEVFQRLIQVLERQESKTDDSLMLTTEDASHVMKISIPTLRDHFLCRPDFPQVWAGRKCLIPRKALEQWLNDERRWQQDYSQ